MLILSRHSRILIRYFISILILKVTLKKVKSICLYHIKGKELLKQDNVQTVQKLLHDNENIIKNIQESTSFARKKIMHELNGVASSSLLYDQEAQFFINKLEQVKTFTGI